MWITMILFAVVGLGVLSPGPTADAQAMCDDGVLVGENCEIEGRPPIRGTGRCPQGSDIVQAGCYRIVPRVGSQCPQGTFEAAGECRQAVALIEGDLSCPDTGYEVVGSRCLKYVKPVCGPLGCRGKITLAYTVGCVGDGISRVELGQPDLFNGAKVSFITLNGSAVIGADLPAGSPINVVVTAERINDEVVVDGPTVAPPCGATASTPTPAPATPTPEPAATAAAAAATAVPDPTATAVPATAVPAATATAVAEPTAAPEPAPGPTTEAAPAEANEPGDAADCPAGQALVDQQCVPPCAEAEPGEECFDVSGASISAPSSDTPLAAVPADSGSDFPIIPLALIGGATVVLAPTAYAIASKRKPGG